MAQQFGMINIRGNVGDITYVRSEDGYLVRRKSSLNKEKVMTDKRFTNTRRVMSEFGYAAQAGKLVRIAVINCLKNIGDSKLHPRMLKKMMAVLATDTVSAWGKRIPQLGNLRLLEGFEFNRKNELIHTLLVQYKANINRAAGVASIDIPAFEPSDVLLIPEGATHFCLVSAACELDFDTLKSKPVNVESDSYAIGRVEVPAFTLEHTITPGSLLPIVLVLGIRFFEQTNGKLNQLNADGFNAVRIVKMDQL